MSIKKILYYSFYALLFLNIFFLSAIVSFQITLKGEMVTLHNLVGKSLDDAKAELHDKKLSIVQSGVLLHESLERGKIIHQDPPPGSKIKINKVVKVILSAGKEKVFVPQLVGKNLQYISQILKDAGLRKGKISHVHTSKYAAGKIIAQHPLPMEEVGRDFRISLLVSQGQKEKKYLMPDLIGKHVAKVIVKLKQMEFNVGELSSSYYPGLDSGIIINQSPSPGSRIQKRNLITMEVSK